MCPNRFPGFSRRVAVLLTMVVGFAFTSRADPIISEFLAANTNVHADEDGAFSDWIEVHNPDETPVNLDGWYLTDSASSKTKWRLPAVTIPPAGYLIVFASNKDRTDPGAPLHTNFALSAGGEYLGLIRPDGSTAASEFAPDFPAQSDNISYGRATLESGELETGFLRQPTPAAANGGRDALLLVGTITFSPPAGIFAQTMTVELEGAGPGQEIRYVTASGPDAAAAAVTPRSAVYSGPITIRTTTLVRAAIYAANGAIRGATSSAHYVKRADNLANFTSKLPLLVIDDLGAGDLIKDGIDHPSWLFGYAPQETDSGVGERAPDWATPLLTTVRGTSSADFPKKGYNVKMRDAQGSRRDVPLLNLPAYERWALVAPWAFDHNYINNSFVYELSNRIGRWAPRTRLAEVFFNPGGDDLDESDYAGIYVVTDRIRIEKGRVDIHELAATDLTAPAVSGGYIVKIDERDEDEIGWRTELNVPSPSSAELLVLVEPDADDIAPAQLEYIQDYIQRMENALLADRDSGWSQRTHLDYIDRPSWIDHHILNTLVNNPDALYRSAYFTKPRGGKLQAGPVWDFDRALGSFWDDRSDVVESWSGIGGHIDLWQSGWWGVLAEDPEFVQAWIERWQNLRLTHFSTSALTTLAQTLANTVGEEAAARDAERWPENTNPYGSYAAQIDVLKNWLTRRTEWIDAQFVGRPAMSNESGMLTFVPPEGAMLAYTLDGTDPRMVGGGIAPNAQTTSEPLIVPASANIHARGHNPEMQGGIPGTAWSSVVSGPDASTLTPRSRVVNISGRAFTGADRNAMVIGVQVSDTELKRYLARGIGPGLVAFGATDTAGNSQVKVSSAAGVELQRNAGWETHPDPAQLRDAARAVGAFQLAEGSADSAVVAELAAGSHLIEIGTNDQPGIALAELYEQDETGRTASFSIRGRVTPGGTLVGGFVVQGDARKRLLIRALGSALGGSGFPDVLVDPLLTIHTSSERVATNDRWTDDNSASAIEAAGRMVGASPLGPESEDAALLVTLEAGAYTLEVKGKGDAEGIVLLEVFDLP